MGRISTITFHNEATQTGNGAEYSVSMGGSNLIMIISTSGTSTARTIHFEGKGQAGEWVAIKCFNKTSTTSATSSSGTSPEIWECGLEGIQKFRVRISAVSGGNLSIFGEVVD
jgi:hypothetical protein